MIVTLTGAFKNAGDYLIGERAFSLLRKHVDQDIVNINRKEIQEKHYELFNQSRAVVLCGGPAYQSNIYPDIYPLELSKIKVPVVPMGLGAKTSLNRINQEYKFTEQSKKFICEIHERIICSGVRDVLSFEVIEKLVHNKVLMTGCPAWYDLEKINLTYQHKKEVQVLSFSTPAVVDRRTLEVMACLSKKFPQVEKRMLFHHGFHSSGGWRGQYKLLTYNFAKWIGTLGGWKMYDVSSNLESMKKCYRESDLHVGYRVHGHLYCLSQKIASFLINEDSRGVGQSMTLQQKLLNGDDPGLLSNLSKVLEQHFEDQGQDIRRANEVMAQKWDEMLKFLKSFSQF